MIKVLHVLGGLENGGAETFLINYLTKLDRKKYKIDFLIRRTQNNQSVVQKFKDLGDNILTAPSWPRHIIKNWLFTRDVIEQGKYNVIHIHANALIYIAPLILAKRNNIHRIILHSHNTKSNYRFGKYVHEINKKLYLHYATDFVACGIEAGKWMFSDKNFQVLNNAVDFEKFKFDQVARSQIRQELGIPEDAFVVGHVGRFVKAKNHEFLITLFEKVRIVNQNAYLVLAGVGELYDEIKDRLNSKKELNNCVFLLGQRNDINKIYSAMDLFAFPSLFEGVPFTLVEAQANGLSIIASDEVSKEVEYTNLIKYLPINSTEEWVATIREYENRKRGMPVEITNSMYDISENVRWLTELYGGK